MSQKLSSKPSFAQKLAVFILENTNKEIKFSETTGFSNSNPAVFGVLPFLHLNITENQFKKMLLSNNEDLTSVLTSISQKKNLDKKLVGVDYHSEPQSVLGVKHLHLGLIESVNKKYKSRTNGKKLLAQILSYQKWQREQGLIPSESLKWANSKDSFAKKLAVFILENTNKEIKFSETTGFSNSNPAVFGVLPFLHLNITENQFKKMLLSNNEDLTSVLTSISQKKNLDKKLVGVDYHSEPQSVLGVKHLHLGLIESVNKKYKSRTNGKKLLAQILSYQKWQREQGLIPPESLKWAN